MLKELGRAGKLENIYLKARVMKEETACHAKKVLVRLKAEEKRYILLILLEELKGPVDYTLGE